MCQGAASFSAIELMFNIDSPDRVHLPQHDLESFFYVIVIIVMLYEEPGMKRGPSYWKDNDVKLAEWWNVQNWHTSAQWKWSTMSSSESYFWNYNVAAHITDYFKCWKDCISNLRDAIFGSMNIKYNKDTHSTKFVNKSPITYDAMIAILERMIELGAAADSKQQEALADSSALESSDGSQMACDTEPIAEWVFTKVEAFRIMDGIEQSVVQVPIADAPLGTSDGPVVQYSTDPYLGSMPSRDNIPKHQNSSIRTSDLPTTSGAITTSVSASASQISMPQSTRSIPPMSSGPSMASSSKQTGPGLTSPPPNDNSNDEPPRKKLRRSQSSKQPPRKDKTFSTSAPASLKTPGRTSNRSRGSRARGTPARASNATGTRASTSARSCRTRGDDDSEYVSPEVKATMQDPDAVAAFKGMRSLRLTEYTNV